MKPIPVDAANHEHFNQIKFGTKELITRHNKEYGEGIFYKDSKVGELLQIVDKKTGATVLVEIAGIQYFRNLDELFKSKLADESFDKTFETKEALSSEYEKNRPGYAALLEKDGVVVWRIRTVTSNLH